MRLVPPFVRLAVILLITAVSTRGAMLGGNGSASALMPDDSKQYKSLLLTRAVSSPSPTGATPALYMEVSEPSGYRYKARTFAVTAVPAAPQAGRAPVAVFKKGNPCSMLLPSEVGQILGVPVTMREIVDDDTCAFPFDQPTPAKGGGDAQLVITIHWDDGPTAVAATRMASKMLGGDAGFQKLQGIGDEAWLGPLASMLVFSKGKIGVEIDLRLIPDGKDKGIRLAKLIASRLP